MAMNRAVAGRLVEQETGRPLVGFQVLVAEVEPGGLQPLGVGVSGDLGRFRVNYPLCHGPVDLTLLVFSPAGRHLFTEPIHRAISGAELQLTVEVPRASLAREHH
jgi:hypothetical protein